MYTAELKWSKAQGQAQESGSARVALSSLLECAISFDNEMRCKFVEADPTRCLLKIWFIKKYSKTSAGTNQHAPRLDRNKRNKEIKIQ